MTELFDFGRHAPYILAAYSVSAIIITALIIRRRKKLKQSLAQEHIDRSKP